MVGMRLFSDAHDGSRSPRVSNAFMFTSAKRKDGLHWNELIPL